MSWYPPRPPRRPGSAPWRAAGKRPFGATWWGKAWVEALEQRARLDSNRLPRGRTYARTGAVDDLEVRSGEVVAAVQGSRAKPYRVTVRVRTYAPREWSRAVEVLASQAGHLAALLDGEMPSAVAGDLAAANIELLPVAGEVQPRCTCPDWADPCKHSAAVCYLVADALDADPFLLFLLRGRDRESLLAALRAHRSAAAGGTSRTEDPEGGGKHGRPRGDPGVAARDAWARWASVASGGDPPLPPLPLPPRRPGAPTVLAVDPPPGTGVTAAGLRRLATDAALRAYWMAVGEGGSGLELPVDVDLARRAASALGPGGEPGAIAELAQAAGLTTRDLLMRAMAWRDGGSEGLFLLLEQWDPPPGAAAAGRRLLGEGATVRRNRVTLGERQLRLGRDGRWHPYRRSVRGAGPAAWTPDGAPLDEEPSDGAAGVPRS